MHEKHYIAELGGWQGFKVGTVGRYDSEAKGIRDEVWIELYPDPDHPMTCSGCEEPTRMVHDCSERWIRDLPVWGADTLLLVHLRRVKCSRCGTAMEKVAGYASQVLQKRDMMFLTNNPGATGPMEETSCLVRRVSNWRSIGKSF